MFLRDVGETEIGGFGISRAGDLLYVEEVVLIPQRSSVVSVAFEDLAVAEFFEDQVARGHPPREFARIWIHTHPGQCPRPSGTDEETFDRVFGSCDWALMFILARHGATYARLQWNVGPRGAMELPVTVDYARPFPASDEVAWQDEYDRCVVPLDFLTPADLELFRSHEEIEGFGDELPLDAVTDFESTLFPHPFEERNNDGF